MIARITFWDHAIGTKERVECECYGEIVSANDEKTLVRYWRAKIDDGDHNDEYITLLTNSIIKVERLVPKKLRGGPAPRKRGRSHG